MGLKQIDLFGLLLNDQRYFFIAVDGINPPLISRSEDQFFFNLIPKKGIDHFLGGTPKLFGDSLRTDFKKSTRLFLELCFHFLRDSS